MFVSVCLHACVCVFVLVVLELRSFLISFFAAIATNMPTGYSLQFASVSSRAIFWTIISVESPNPHKLSHELLTIGHGYRPFSFRHNEDTLFNATAGTKRAKIIRRMENKRKMLKSTEIRRVYIFWIIRIFLVPKATVAGSPSIIVLDVCGW